MMKGRVGMSPRIHVSVTPETYAAVQKVAKANRQSVSGVVSEILDMMAPVLERVAGFKELAERMEREAREGMVDRLTEIQDEMEPALAKVLGVFAELGSGSAEKVASARSDVGGRGRSGGV